VSFPQKDSIQAKVSDLRRGVPVALFPTTDSLKREVSALIFLTHKFLPSSNQGASYESRNSSRRNEYGERPERISGT
jgi:hypothetical protein